MFWFYVALYALAAIFTFFSFKNVFSDQDDWEETTGNAVLALLWPLCLAISCGLSLWDWMGERNWRRSF